MRIVDDLTSWNADWSGLRVAVLGLGVTGFSVADTLIELGCDVLVVAAAAEDNPRNLLAVIGGGFVDHSDETAVPTELVDFDPELVIVSPGFRVGHPIVAWALDRDAPLWGDIELAWRLRDKVTPAAEWLLISGTQRRDTTAEITTHLLEAAGLRVASVGADGIPALDAVRYPAGFDVLVVTVSGAQAHWLNHTPNGSIVPWASVCMNALDDTSGWHGTAREYRDDLGRVYTNTKIAAIYNRADSATMRMVENAEVTEGARAVGFGLDAPGPSDFGIVDGILCDRAFLEERFTTALEISTRDELTVVGLGEPDALNAVLAAAALVRSLDVDAGIVRGALLTL
ncbi:hypothetical protein [Glaciihabitans sp. dw_435]|uniref:hypothetical protein n=1 Tax=Glaciihabitans sp. dw_435 TaxID=2720081 RepID=UPI001BD51DC4|nr:hypothetical protein [Glaciihabitans sp. dw_435]